MSSVTTFYDLILVTIPAIYQPCLSSFSIKQHLTSFSHSVLFLMLSSVFWMFSVSPKQLLLIFPYASWIPPSCLVSFLSLHLEHCNAWMICLSHWLGFETLNGETSLPKRRRSTHSRIFSLLHNQQHFLLNWQSPYSLGSSPHTFLFFLKWKPGPGLVTLSSTLLSHLFSQIHWTSGMKLISPASPISCETEDSFLSLSLILLSFSAFLLPSLKSSINYWPQGDDTWPTSFLFPFLFWIALFLSSFSLSFP